MLGLWYHTITTILNYRNSEEQITHNEPQQSFNIYFFAHPLYWVGQKVSSGFFHNFLANPVL